MVIFHSYVSLPEGIYFWDVPASYGWLPEGTGSLMRNPAALKIGVLVRRWCNVISRRLATFSKLGRVPWQQKISRLIFCGWKWWSAAFDDFCELQDSDWVVWFLRTLLWKITILHGGIGKSLWWAMAARKVWSTWILRISQSETQAPQ